MERAGVGLYWSLWLKWFSFETFQTPHTTNYYMSFYFTMRGSTGMFWDTGRGSILEPRNVCQLGELCLTTCFYYWSLRTAVKKELYCYYFELWERGFGDIQWTHLVMLAVVMEYLQEPSCGMWKIDQGYTCHDSPPECRVWRIISNQNLESKGLCTTQALPAARTFIHISYIQPTIIAVTRIAASTVNTSSSLINMRIYFWAEGQLSHTITGRNALHREI